MNLYLMVGLPGSGKSTTAKQIQQEEGGIILSTDDLFCVQDEQGESLYLWDSQALREAHRVNLMKCKVACERKIGTIIIDNTNLTEQERQPYTLLGNLCEYKVIVKKVNTPWAMDAEECFKRNTHGVPLEVIKRMLGRIDLL